MGRRLERRRWGPLGWLAALLGASILNSRFPMTQAQDREDIIPITLEPPEAFVGENITLTPGGKPNFTFCHWSRKNTRETNWILMYFVPPKPWLEVGPLYTGRETVGPECSLHITNLTRKDNGRYTVRKMGSHFISEKGMAHIKLTTRRVLDKGVIAGIVVGALAGAVLIGGLLYYFLSRYCKRMVQRVSKSSLLPSVPATKPTV